MVWLRQPFTLPILLGLSLTSFGIAVIYVLLKKEEDDIKFRKKNVEVIRCTSIQYKVPRQFVPAVIGRGGSTIKDVQDKTGTQIYFEKDNIECPDRVCTIKGSHTGVNLAEEMIKSIIQNQPVIETYEMYIPQNVCSKIMGRGGEVIQQIQRISSAKVIVERNYTPNEPNGERKVTIKGTTEQIATALSHIEDKVREEKIAHTTLEASSAARLPRGKLSPRSTIVNTSEPNIESVSLKVADGLMEVYVSGLENPNQFWVQVVGSGTTAFDKLLCEMTAYYNDEENCKLHALRSITPGQIVAAKFRFATHWYRGQVMSEPEDEQCEVYFMDYGDIEVVPLNYVLELRTDFLSLRMQAIECSLANIKPKENEWSNEACARFSELSRLAEWKILIAKVRGYKERSLGYGKFRREDSPIPCVDLYDKNDDKDINIGQELINEGLAEPEETLTSTASSTLSLSTPRSHEMTNISSPASTSPLAKRAMSPETSVNTSRKLDSTIDSPNTSVIDLDTSKDVPLPRQVEEINLITPHKPKQQIEEIDLVTPVKEETSRFIETEIKVYHEDGAGDYLRNGSSNQHGKFKNSKFQISKSSLIAPAGYESDISDNSDELELG